ncbi:MAG: O-antigen ligase family protein, partial [Candidatus Eisenbacteria bacterium]
AAEPLASFANMKKLILIAIVYCFAWLVRSRKTLKATLTLLLSAALVLSLYGIVSYFHGSGLEESYRVRATVSSTVTLGGLLLLVFSMSLLLSLVGSRGRQRLLPAAAALASFLCLILTFTRGAWVGAALVFLFSLVFLSGKGRIILVSAVLAIALVSLSSARVRERTASFAQVEEMSIRGRISMWLSATEIVKDHAGFGAGLMDLGQVYERYRRPDWGFTSGHMHSSYFHVMASTGLVGLAVFLWFMRSLCALLLRNLRAVSSHHVHERAVCLGALAGFLGFCVAGVFEWNFGDAEVVSLLYCFVGLSCACERLTSDSPVSREHA